MTNSVRGPKRSKSVSKRTITVFYLKVNLSPRKSATEFHCVKTVSSKVVRHSLACRPVQKWLVGTSPSTWRYGQNWPTLSKNADFQSYSLAVLQP